ncbi:hypothetical protein Taro_006073 [Colocasia esculenta]|uniref:Uncharacterized protein n=1 Tax=Colocasia esculenta TaxID=4460 RepID=A0A843TUA0_COLES|nr:hypothetical protein [Colocasia esculenta]
MQFSAQADPRPRAPLFPGVRGRVRIGCFGLPRAPGPQSRRRLCLAGSRPPRLSSALSTGDGSGGWLRGSSRGAALLRGPEEVRWLSGRGGGRTSNGLHGRLVLGLKAGGPDNVVSLLQGPAERIKKALQKVELSISSYDTAWVAMVPSYCSPENPQFPQCVDWILNNQHGDGSWGPHCHPRLMKDTLSSTLASVIALKRWDLGEDHIKKGINFILSNMSFISDENQHSPLGFNIIFPCMIGFARDMGLHLPMNQTDEEILLHMRQLELERNNSKGAIAYLAYVAEGLDRFPAWEDLRKYQRENGSLFDSPSTTAAALAHYWDSKCFEYLSSLLQKFGNAGIQLSDQFIFYDTDRYPLDTHAYLHMVDWLEGFGISWLFRKEIKNILDELHVPWHFGSYGCRDMKSLMVLFCFYACPVEFIQLSKDGASDHVYKVSGYFTQLDEDFFHHSLEGYLEDTKTVLELYRASQLKFPTEWFFDKLNFWTSNFLAQKAPNIRSDEQLSEVDYLASSLVDYALKFPFFANLERLDHRRNIMHFNAGDFQILKTSSMLWNIYGKDILDLAAKEFKSCQWIKENGLDQLSFARQKLSYCYFSAAATLFPSVMSDVRISWAKNGVLTTLVDDFFDVGGSREELINFIQLIERCSFLCFSCFSSSLSKVQHCSPLMFRLVLKFSCDSMLLRWDEDYERDCCSEQVKILYSALRTTVNELGAKASLIQKCSVTSHIIEIVGFIVWLDLVRSMMREAEWLQKKTTPTKEQYLSNGYVSFALGPIILPALYFVGSEICPDTIKDPECQSLFKLVSTCGRLLNDMQGFEREAKEGKLNSVSLLMLESDGSMSEDEVKIKIRSLIKSNREELLKLVLQSEGSVVPRACKDLFWKMSKILHFFYMSCDGFTSPSEMVGAVNAVVHDPIELALDSQQNFVEMCVNEKCSIN